MRNMILLKQQIVFSVRSNGGSIILPRHRCHRAAPDAAGLEGNETRVLQRAETGIGVAAGGSTAAAAHWLRASHARLGKEEGGAMQETASVAAPLAPLRRRGGVRPRQRRLGEERGAGTQRSAAAMACCAGMEKGWGIKWMRFRVWRWREVAWY